MFYDFCSLAFRFAGSAFEHAGRSGGILKFSWEQSRQTRQTLRVRCKPRKRKHSSDGVSRAFYWKHGIERATEVFYCDAISLFVTSKITFLPTFYFFFESLFQDRLPRPKPQEIRALHICRVGGVQFTLGLRESRVYHFCDRASWGLPYWGPWDTAEPHYLRWAECWNP